MRHPMCRVTVAARSPGDLMWAVAPEVAYSTGALARWENSKLGTLVGQAVFGALLTPADFRAGLIGVSGRQLFVVDFGKIAIKEAAVKLSRLDHTAGKPSVSIADRSQLTVTEAVSGNDVVLTIIGALNLRPRFSTDDGRAEQAKAIAAAITAAKP